MYVGDAAALNSSDIWTVKTEGKERALHAPGTSDEITGVVPVRSMNAAAFDAMRNHAPTLLNLHVAASLRGSLVCIPGDLTAMLAAVAVRLCVQLFQEPTEATAVALTAVARDLRGRGSLGVQDRVLDVLKSQDPRPALSGRCFIASGLKPLALILSGSLRPSESLTRGILGYSMYIAAGRVFDAAERSKCRVAMLGIRPEKVIPVGAPGTQDVKSPQHCREYTPAGAGPCR